MQSPEGAAAHVNTHLLLIECPDEEGLISKITGVLFRHGFNIVSNHEFVDRLEDRFFMRTAFTGDVRPDAAVEEIGKLLPQGARIRLADRPNRSIAVLVTKEHHCLAELLVRHAFGELGASIGCVVSNYDLLEPLASRFGVPFFHVAHEDRDRADYEAEVRDVIDRYSPRYIVLAKYMRILTPAFVAAYPRRIINIHHSFLPAFVGARPYQQA
ncbi:MAG TPA: formyltransferase family protein, partial [Rhodothermales bacterium]|nr:formyltransferase family protein [Rhodothermales bacterium]